jgi:tRNA nucleotidyltransferase (CCA-adding enzyme)
LPSALVDELGALPGGAELLAAAARTSEAGAAYLVGGSVRDLLRGAAPRELDVVVEGDIRPLLEALGGTRVLHDRFGTASAELGGARVDVTTSRRERYARPGALPEVEPAPLAEDLLRRDFTVNAIAVALANEDSGRELLAAPHAREDLAQGLLRVLHDDSFIDDPTRLWRLGRYAARLGFRAEEHTAELAEAALAKGAPSTVSGTRTGAELRLALDEDDPLAALAELRSLGLLAAAGLDGELDEPLVRDALGLLAADGRPEILTLAVLLGAPRRAGVARDTQADEDGRAEHDGSKLVALLDRLEFSAADRDRTVASVLALPRLVRELPACGTPSALYALASAAPPEAVALAGALGGEDRAASRTNAQRWLRDVRHVRLQITGDDLIAAGVAEGPEIGRRLRAALDARLDGRIGGGREAELQAALAAS